jgi:hypothetical protein
VSTGARMSSRNTAEEEANEGASEDESKRRRCGAMMQARALEDTHGAAARQHRGHVRAAAAPGGVGESGG